MLFVFRLHQRHPIGLKTDYTFSSNLSDVDHATLHLRDAEPHLFSVYDVEIIAKSITPDNPKVKDDTVISPMNIEFAVFVEKKSPGPRHSFCWFSLTELWHFLDNGNSINKIPVNDRMSGQFICWKTLIAGADTKKAPAKRTTLFCRKSPTQQLGWAPVPWPVDNETIFVSNLALWHFIFSSPYSERADFLAQMLKRYVYPTIESMMSPCIVDFAENSTAALHHDKPSRWALMRARLAACLSPLHRQHPPKHHFPSVNQYQYLKHQLNLIENQLNKIKKYHETSDRYRLLEEWASAISDHDEVRVSVTPYRLAMSSPETRPPLIETTV